MWPSSEPEPSAELTSAETAIAAALRGGESLPAWNAVWDLVQSTDAQGKQEILDALRGYVDSTVAGPSTKQAQEFQATIEASITSKRRGLVASREVRRHAKQAQIEAQQEALRKAGVRPGEGIPMWMMYMTRRNKRSWR